MIHWQPVRFACTVCEHLWFYVGLVQCSGTSNAVPQKMYPGHELFDNLCDIYWGSLCSAKVPLISTCKGINYPEHSTQLPLLKCISGHIISRRFPFIQIRCSWNTFDNFDIVGRVVTVPADIHTMVKSLPRHLHDDHVVDVHIKWHMMQKSLYILDWDLKKAHRECLPMMPVHNGSL